MPPRSPRAQQRGFAMLLIFLMASIVAISLYLELPRVAMDTQRAKEQLLIDRGEQYKRAIQLYYKKTQRYPAKIEDLESFNNMRFLRHKYVDPMTGKDEWRIIHINNGVLTDSILTKPGQGQDPTKQAANTNQFIGEQVGLGGTAQAGAGGAANVRDRRRASEGRDVNGPPSEIPANNNLAGGSNTMPGIPGVPTPGSPNSGTPQPGVMPFPAQPGQVPYPTPGQVTPFPGQQPGQNLPGVGSMPGTMQPGTFQPGMTQPGMPGTLAGRGATAPSSSGGGFVGSSGGFVGSTGGFVGGGSLVGSQPGNPGTTGQYPGAVQYPGQTLPGQTYPGQTYPGQTLPGQPGAPVNSQFGGVSPYSTAPGANGLPPNFPQPGATTNAPSNAAADMIRNILTTPRPGGMPTAGMGGQTIGGGIAGIASNSDGEGVMVYNDRTLYGEWEFIFDPTKVKQIPNPNVQTAMPGTPASQMGNMSGTGPAGTPVQGQPGQPSPFGSGTFPGMQPGTTQTSPVGR